MQKIKIILSAGAFLMAAGTLFAFKAAHKLHPKTTYFYQVSGQTDCFTTTCSSVSSVNGACIGGTATFYTASGCLTQSSPQPTQSTLFAPTGL
jgi:hypothetical protein